MDSFSLNHFEKLVIVAVINMNPDNYRAGVDSQAQRTGFALQEMSGFLPVFREEVEVISCNAEGARKAGRPQSDQGSSLSASYA